MKVFVEVKEKDGKVTKRQAKFDESIFDLMDKIKRKMQVQNSDCVPSVVESTHRAHKGGLTYVNIDVNGIDSITISSSEINLDESQGCHWKKGKENAYSNFQMFNTPFGSSNYCPFRFISEKQKKELAMIQEKEKQNNPGNDKQHMRNKSVLVAVCCLIENQDTNEVLITRRAPHLRTFPCVWVLPGGGVDSTDCNLFESVIREVKEEVDLDITKEQLKPLCCWESCYPTLLEDGLPKRHHFIFYFKATVNFSNFKSKDPYTAIRMQVEEVDAMAWLSRKVLSIALYSNQLVHDHIHVFPAVTLHHTLNDHTKQDIKQKGLQMKLPISRLQIYPSEKEIIQSNGKARLAKERLSTATIFVLEQWFRNEQVPL